MFKDKVYNLLKKIPKGKITTYKAIGRSLHKKGQIYRAVGRALKDNKSPVIIPCHRVVCSNASLGGYQGKLNSKKKISLLKKEGIIVENNKIKDFKKKLFKF